MIKWTDYTLFFNEAKTYSLKTKIYLVQITYNIPLQTSSHQSANFT